MNTETLVTLNNLVLINHDRMAGYEEAIQSISTDEKAVTENADLLSFFQCYCNDSMAFSNELAMLAGEDIYQPDDIDGSAGLRGWTTTHTNRAGLLEACYSGEQKTRQAYEYALDESALTADTRNLLVRQKEEVERAQKILDALMKRMNERNIARA